MNDKELAIAIARCEEIAKAQANPIHPCRKVVDLQNDMPARHVPEAWFGNLSGSLVLFVASNPSIDRVTDGTGENYPKSTWSDHAIGEWITRRTDQTWSEVPVTFRRPGYNNFLSRCEDGEYRGSQRRGLRTIPQTTWNRTHVYASELIGSAADPSKNYVLTETVHCKSEGGKGVKEAGPLCTAKWLGPTMSNATNARVMVLFGTKVRDFWTKTAPGVPREFGQGRSGLTKSDIIRQNSYVDSQFGTRRVAFYLPHPSASGEKGETMSVAGLYGDKFLAFVREVIDGSLDVPNSSEELWDRF